MYNEISQLVEKLQVRRGEAILLVGDYMLDEYLFGDTDRISPEAPVPVLKVVERQTRLGGAGSVGASLASLGAKAYCAGVVGNDAAGAAVCDLLTEIGADTSAIIRGEGIPTTVKQRLIGLAQHRIKQQLLRVDMEDSRHYHRELIEEVKEKLVPLLDKVRLIAVEDYDKGLFGSDHLLKWLVREGSRRGKPILADPARVSDYERYRGVDVITPNRVEASMSSGVDIKTVEDACRAGEILRTKYEIGAVLVKLDRDGIFISQENGDEHIPTKPREVFDNTGAGDVVLAALAVGMSEGMDLRSASVLANVGGGWEVEQAGAVPITREQLIFELLKQNRRHRGKLVERSQLLGELKILRGAGKRIAFTNGCFDLLHPGHVSYLEFAREQGDVLVVGMNSDRSVKAIKGPNRPLVGELERARMVAALEAVDYVVIFDEPSVIELVKQVRPEVLVKGQDYTVEGVVGHEFVLSYGGKVALAPIEHEYSTSKIIQTIIERMK
ncbi:MAG: D-glycero-beta-D-manno-heptose 1-phosphate adenylyltransferase [Phycisphaerae bacterium]